MFSSQPDDGTRQLLYTGLWTLAAGALAALLTATVCGGIGRQGPHTNSGWMCLMVAMMCLPFGSMAFALGAAKWLRNRRLGNAARQRAVVLPLKPRSRDAKSL
jgi:drug/metabolite transporter (DMT)-like permease